MYLRIVCYVFVVSFLFFKQKTEYEMRISDWSSDVCSSDLAADEIIDIIIAAGFKLGCRPGPDDPPVLEHRHAMRDGPRARHVMGDGDGRDPEIAYKADDQAVGRMGTDRVQPGRRLVEEQDFRMARDGAGERDPLLHAPRKFRRAQVQHLRAEPALFDIFQRDAPHPR